MQNDSFYPSVRLLYDHRNRLSIVSPRIGRIKLIYVTLSVLFRLSSLGEKHQRANISRGKNGWNMNEGTKKDTSDG